MFNVDPVCGKKLRRKQEYAILKYGGNNFYFCCKACKEEFEKTPIKYIPEGVSPSKKRKEGI